VWDDDHTQLQRVNQRNLGFSSFGGAIIPEKAARTLVTVSSRLWHPQIYPRLRPPFSLTLSLCGQCSSSPSSPRPLPPLSPLSAPLAYVPASSFSLQRRFRPFRLRPSRRRRRRRRRRIHRLRICLQRRACKRFCLCPLRVLAFSKGPARGRSGILATTCLPRLDLVLRGPVISSGHALNFDDTILPLVVSHCTQCGAFSEIHAREKVSRLLKLNSRSLPPPPQKLSFSPSLPPPLPP
jgi:hypothetical protein